MAVQHVETLEQFNKLINDNKFVITDFWAEWCGPCKAIAPLYEKLSKEHSLEGKLVFAKVDVDKAPRVAQEYAVTAMPTFMFFANGAPAAVDAALPPSGGPGGSGAIKGPNGIDFIRGADPRALTAVAAKLGELAKKHAGAASA